MVFMVRCTHGDVYVRSTHGEVYVTLTFDLAFS